MKEAIIGTIVAAVIVIGLYAATEGGDTRPATANQNPPSIPTFKVQ